MGEGLGVGFFFGLGPLGGLSLVGQLLELQGLFQRLPGDVAQHHPVGCRMWLHAGASLAMLEKPSRELGWGTRVGLK